MGFWFVLFAFQGCVRVKDGAIMGEEGCGCGLVPTTVKRGL